MMRAALSRLVALARRPAAWRWLAALLSAAAAAGGTASPEVRDLVGVGLAAAVRALAGG